MTKRILLATALLALSAAAQATLYHPELLTISLQRPPLIDCGHGFKTALTEYFTHFASRDGVAIPALPSLVRLDREQASWVSHFAITSGSKRYAGIIYVEPSIEDEDDDLPPPVLPRPKERFCSAVFVEEPAPTAERAQIEKAYADLCARFGVTP